MPASTRPLALLAILAGCLSLLLLALSASPPPTEPAQALEFIDFHRAAFAFFASTVLAWSVFSIPFTVYLGAHLKVAGSALAPAAVTLTVAGLLMLGFATFMSVGSMLALVSAAPAPNSEAQAYQFRVWSHLGFYLTDPGLMAWGLGQLLFGWLAIRRGAFPRWINTVALIGGISGLLTLAVYQTAVLAVVQLLSFAVWTLAIGLTLLRASAIAPTTGDGA